MSTTRHRRVDALREALATRVVVADGAMGTMLQAQDPPRGGVPQLEGCNEIFHVTRRDFVRSVHEEHLAVAIVVHHPEASYVNASRAGGGR